MYRCKVRFERRDGCGDALAKSDLLDEPRLRLGEQGRGLASADSMQ
jgi:hypothetical protein